MNASGNGGCPRADEANPKSAIQNPESPRGGFSLVELLVVIGILSVLISMLLPALSSAYRQANTIKCQAQLRDIGIQLTIYAGDNNGWLYPVGPLREDPADPQVGMYKVLGTNKAPAYRWPMYVFQFSHPPIPVPEPAEKQPWSYEDIRPFNPPIMACPGDPETPYGHSYVLNAHLIESKEKVIKAGNRIPDGRPTSEAILMGEKRSDQGDYYMQKDEFYRVVEPYRHGLAIGSNYLYLDGHVATALPEPVREGLDPWDIPAETPTTQPN